MAGFCPHCMTEHETGVGACPACGGDMMATNEPFQLPAGKILVSPNGNQYLAGRVLGSGGFGITYVSREMNSGRLCAVKEFFPIRCQPQHQADGSVYVPAQSEELFYNGMKNFLLEAQTLSSLAHIPSVVKIQDYFEANGTAYTVMEYLKGETLQQHLKAHGTEPFSMLISQMRPLLKDMQAMHDAGVVHRDVAPDNIVMLPDGSFRLIDFGCARFWEDGKSMTVMLKPGFCPPEQYLRHGQGPFTDVYGLCATLYYCITGQVPLDAPNRLEEDALARPSSLGAKISAQHEAALLRGLNPQPKERTQSVTQLMQEMEGPIPNPVGLLDVLKKKLKALLEKMIKALDSTGTGK